MAGTRADHYVWASDLVAKARRRMDATGPEGWSPDSAYDRGNVLAWLAAAQVHATLAAAGPGVEQAVLDNERAVARALGAAEGDQRARQAARPPLPQGKGAATEEEIAAAARRIDGGWAAPGDRAMVAASLIANARAESMDPEHHRRVEQHLNEVNPEGAERATTCRCTGMPHDLGSPGCEQPTEAQRREARRQTTLDLAEAQRAAEAAAMGGRLDPADRVRLEETAGTVRPKPGPDNRPYCRCSGGGGLDGQHRRGVPGCTR